MCSGDRKSLGVRLTRNFACEREIDRKDVISLLLLLLLPHRLLFVQKQHPRRKTRAALSSEEKQRAFSMRNHRWVWSWLSMSFMLLAMRMIVAEEWSGFNHPLDGFFIYMFCRVLGSYPIDGQTIHLTYHLSAVRSVMLFFRKATSPANNDWSFVCHSHQCQSFDTYRPLFCCSR